MHHPERGRELLYRLILAEALARPGEGLLARRPLPRMRPAARGGESAGEPAAGGSGAVGERGEPQARSKEPG